MEQTVNNVTDREQSLDEQLRSAMPAVMERIKRETLQAVETRAIQAASEVAVNAAREWAVENLVPEIKAQLEAGKAGMVASAEGIASRLSAAIGDALVAQATEKLSNSWNVRKVSEALFS